MYIITTKPKGNYTVVGGFRKQHVDPTATRKAILKAWADKGLPDYLVAAQDVVAKNVKLPKRTPGRSKAIESAHIVLMDAEKRYAAECVADRSNHTIYLPPKSNEILLSKEDSKPLRRAFKTLKRKEYLTVEGEKIVDTVGLEYWVEVDGRWEMTTITEFGETPPIGSKTRKDLNKNQRKAIRDQKQADDFDALTTQEKSELHANAVRGAKLEAVTRRSIAEIEGADSAEALANAQEWLAIREAELAAEYA